MSRHSLVLPTAVAIVLLMTVIVTWPQALHLGSQVAAHNDPHFSIWRLGWVAHALQTDPRRLFDANIFYPETRTLAYSDATLLEGAVAAPLWWAQVPPVVIYNVLLLGGIVASGAAMFVLARYLTGSAAAAMVSAAIFTMAPYRLEHFMHLELQWTMWIPLALWAVHRAFDGRPLKWGLWAGLFVWLQVISSVYYGVFLAIVVVALGVLLAATDWRRARAAAPGLLAGALVAAILIFPYMRPYMQNAKTLGPRSEMEIAQYSARPVNYLASPPQNWLWGWTADRFGANEARLFPGLGAMLLAIAGFAHRPRRVVLIYAALCALAVELSFGTNGATYAWLYQKVPPLHGLRAPARFAILASGALAAVAGFGFAAIGERLHAGRALLVGVLSLLTVEYASSKMFLIKVADNPPDVYKVIRGIGPGVVAELPMPRADTLPAWDAIYESWSINHWHPLVNGYSGYYTPAYMRTLDLMRRFPDDESIARLRALNVRFIIVHRAFYDAAAFGALLDRMAGREELQSDGRYGDPVDVAQLFELRPAR